jgi:DNA-binding winged helix-turn-helix (wHTH) protein/Tol biopolymer transport system component
MKDLYHLGDYEIDLKRRQIRRDGALVPLAQKPFEVLLVLMDRPGVVTKDELMKAVWGDAFVEESNLTQSVFLLRKALTDTVTGRRYIVTLPGVGYQLGVQPVEVRTAGPEIETGTVPPMDAAVSKPGVRRTYPALAGAFALIALLLLGWGIRRMLRPASFSDFSIQRLTNSGDIQLTAISASGRYVAYVAKNAQGHESLSVLEVRSGNSHVILDQAGILFDDIAFSPDDSYVYYRQQAKPGPAEISSEYRIPLLGGPPTLLIRDIDGPVAFLDGGQRVCFWRGDEAGQFAVLSADAESGRDEKTLAKGVGPMPFTAVCSPDGQRAALSSEVGGITMLDFKSGERRPFYEASDAKEIYSDLTWKADGSGLVADVITPTNFYPSLITISYPGAVRTQITQDLNSYRNPGITADERKIVARQSVANTQFQSFSLPLLADNPEVISFSWSAFLGWRSDQEIVGSTASGGLKLKSLETSQETLIQTPRGMQFLQPNGCGSSMLVATGMHLPDKNLDVWRMNADGSNLMQLSRGPEDILAACTPDSRWVVYADNSARGEAALYRVSTEGGTPQKIGEGSVWFAVSHHADRVAWIRDVGGHPSLVLVDVEGGKQTASVAVPPTLQTMRSLTFAPDDKSVLVMVRGEGADSIYTLPLDGSGATKQIEFRGAHLSTLMVSPGGKYLGVVTAKPVSDAVLLQESPR